jgi:truncated hemoglobin YjbI
VLDLDDVIENFDRMTQHMENTVVSMVTDNSKEIEEILKQLLIYLDSTSKNLDGINTAVGDFIDDYEKSAGKGSLGGEDFYKIKETVEGFYEKIKQAQDRNALKNIRIC